MKQISFTFIGGTWFQHLRGGARNLPLLFTSSLPPSLPLPSTSTFPSPPPPFSLPLPSLPLPYLSLRTRTPKIQLGGLGERCELPSGVRGKALAEIEFRAFYP